MYSVRHSDKYIKGHGYAFYLILIFDERVIAYTSLLGSIRPFKDIMCIDLPLPKFFKLVFLVIGLV